MAKEKQYLLSVIEECIMNPKFQGYHGGRIEVYKSGKHYAVDEIRFFIPQRFIEKFRELFDGLELEKKELFRIGEIDIEKYRQSRKKKK